jgi:hypothetical protein
MSALSLFLPPQVSTERSRFHLKSQVSSFDEVIVFVVVEVFAFACLCFCLVFYDSLCFVFVVCLCVCLSVFLSLSFVSLSLSFCLCLCLCQSSIPNPNPNNHNPHYNPKFNLVFKTKPHPVKILLKINVPPPQPPSKFGKFSTMSSSFILGVSW